MGSGNIPEMGNPDKVMRGKGYAHRSGEQLQEPLPHPAGNGELTLSLLQLLTFLDSRDRLFGHASHIQGTGVAVVLGQLLERG